jgi:hypothetical protein
MGQAEERGRRRRRRRWKKEEKEEKMDLLLFGAASGTDFHVTQKQFPGKTKVKFLDITKYLSWILYVKLKLSRSTLNNAVRTNSFNVRASLIFLVVQVLCSSMPHMQQMAMSQYSRAKRCSAHVRQKDFEIS